ncbi:hypothetical protein DB347_10090 [Opitutaceae bacterium EW11]|nr:hypothetical protein DB347_10090 [Opitutaceae bacterium EW11]
MKKQASYRTETPNPHFANGTTAQHPPAHTVPHGSNAVRTSAAESRTELEGIAELPVRLTPELLKRGQTEFNVYCAVCHGPDGYGRGIVVRRGFPAPPSFHDERLRNAPIGHFVAVMTHGYGMMYAYGDRVREADRWAIAAYIRALQRSQNALPEDVPATERDGLAGP